MKEMGIPKSDNSGNQSLIKANVPSMGEYFQAKSSNSISSDARKDDINLNNQSNKLQIFDDNFSSEQRKRLDH